MIEGAAMSYLTEEIASQPGCWTKAIELAASAQSALPRPGERVAAIGCGSSLNVARCYAALREAAGQGETDAFPASEVPLTRRYDRLVLISRTGTTTEVLDALRRAPRDVKAVAVTADPRAPLAREADQVGWLDFTTERSVVSTRTSRAPWRVVSSWLNASGPGLRPAAGPLPPAGRRPRGDAGWRAQPGLDPADLQRDRSGRIRPPAAAVTGTSRH